MKTIARALGVLSLICLTITGVGAIVYYLIEFISSFIISTIDLVGIGKVFWKVIYTSFGCAVCSFVLAYFIDKH